VEGGLQIYRADTGSCNGCDIEVLAALAPRFGLQELNIEVVEQPEEANVLLVTGLILKKTQPEIKKLHDRIREPKLVIAYGQCAVSKDVFYDSYNAVGALDEVIPVNVYIPGCPPRPQAALYAITKVLGVEEFKAESDLWKVPEVFRGKLSIDEDKCIGCSACVRICPSAAIDLEEEEERRIFKFWYSKCVGCGLCRDICPPEAITMTEDYRLATEDRHKAYSAVTKIVQRCAGCGREYLPSQISEFGLAAVLLKAAKYEENREKLLEAAAYCTECRRTLDRAKAGKRLLLELNRRIFNDTKKEKPVNA